MPSNIVRSESNQISKVSLLPGTILRDQDGKAVLLRVAELISRLSRLYQIPNWSNESSVDLAEWVIENYRYDRLEVVEACLKNPPATDQKEWRLTPDTIRGWMQIVLDKEAEQRERLHQKLKAKYITEASEQYQPVSSDTEKMVSEFLEQLKPEPKPVEISLHDFKGRGKYPKSIAKEYLESKSKGEQK